MKPFVVAVSGEKDHGKSTLARMVASLIYNKFCVETHVEHVALPMYQIAAILTGDDGFLVCPEEAKHRIYSFERGQMTGTEILQNIGQLYGREFFGCNVWVNIWKKRAFVHSSDSIVFYPDCRMVEDRQVCDMGIWISAPGVISKQNTNHETERYLYLMKELADLHVVRDGERYTPDLLDIASQIVAKYSHRSLIELRKENT